MTVQVATDRHRELWHQYVASRNLPHIFDWRWRGILERTFAHDPYYLLHFSDNALTGILPLFKVRSIFTGRSLVSMPYLNGGGAVVDTEAAFRELYGEIEANVSNRQVASAEVRCFTEQRLFGRRWRSRSHKVLSHLYLPDDPDRLYSNFPAKLRSQIRRSLRENADLKIALGTDEHNCQLQGFYDVFAQNMKDLGTPVYPLKLFEETLRTFGAQAAVATVWLQGRAIAGGICVWSPSEAEIIWASSLRQYARIAPNMLLYGSLLRFFCEQKVPRFNFGRSSIDSGVLRFKEQWGAEHMPMWWYSFAIDNALADVSLANPRFSLASTVWKRMPLAMTKKIGPWLTASLP